VNVSAENVRNEQHIFIVVHPMFCTDLVFEHVRIRAHVDG
jgi:hypothetical protein